MNRRRFFIISLGFLLLTGCREPMVKNSSVTEESKMTQPAQSSLTELESILSTRDLPIQTYPNKRDKKAMVVYIPFPSSEKSLERKLISLRVVNQTLREFKNIERISIWSNQEAAQQFANNQSNSQERLDWDGLNDRVAIAYVDENGVTVSYALGRDDFVDISFGMAKLE